MALTWLYLSDRRSRKSPWPAFLTKEGYTVIRCDDPAEVESIVQKERIDGLLFEGKSGTSIWNATLATLQKYPSFPAAFALPAKDLGRSEFGEDELRLFLFERESKGRKRQVLKNLLSLGSLRRRLHEQEKGLRHAVQVNPLAMFDRLEINHIIDRMLGHFGPLIPARNVHWITHSEMLRLFGLDENSYKLELTHRFMTNPLLRSYREGDLSRVHSILRKIPWEKSGVKANESFLNWEALGKRHALIELRGGDGDNVIGHLFLEEIEADHIDFLAGQIIASMRYIMPLLVMGLRCWEAESQGFKDILTPLYNQRFLSLVIDSEINRCKRTEGEFTVLFLDVDYFKLVNDTRGHWIGSKIIQQLGQMLFENIRSCDYGFRYGGDEFVIILTGTGAEAGKSVAERIRRDIADKIFEVDGQTVSVTVSIGVAAYPQHGLTKEEVLKIADQAMYSGKNKSRNLVYLAS
jgi:diguanylate cyclase (GGDEF)-like protein